MPLKKLHQPKLPLKKRLPPKKLRLLKLWPKKRPSLKKPHPPKLPLKKLHQPLKKQLKKRPRANLDRQHRHACRRFWRARRDGRSPS
jgi:hypothetical protein